MHWIDPDHLPETSGVVDCFLQNTKGEADGLILTDGTEIHFPPHMAGDVISALRPGGTVTVRGVRPRGVAMIAAVSVQPEDGTRIIDAGPPPQDEHRKAARKEKPIGRAGMEAQGVLRQVLHGPKGETRGLLLEDGRTGRFPPHASEALAGLLHRGNAIFMRGEGLVTECGTVIAVLEIGTSTENLLRLDSKKSKSKDHKARAHGPQHGNADVSHAL
jgi:hypothetical protein